MKKGSTTGVGDRTDWDRDPRPPTGGLAGALESDPIGQLAHTLRIHHNGSISSHGWPFVTHGGSHLLEAAQVHNVSLTHLR